MPFLLYDRSSITEEEIKLKHKEFKEADDLDLFQALNEIVDLMTCGIKGLKAKCPGCEVEVRSELTFPSGASSLFKKQNILGKYRTKK